MRSAKCPCCKQIDESKITVLDRYCNHSAFNGYHYTPSDYSAVRCVVCGNIWRTKASYVSRLKDDPEFARAGVRGT